VKCKCNVVGKGAFDSVASDAGIKGVRSASRPVDESVQIPGADLRRRV